MYIPLRMFNQSKFKIQNEHFVESASYVSIYVHRHKTFLHQVEHRVYLSNAFQNMDCIKIKSQNSMISKCKVLICELIFSLAYFFL